MEILATSAIIVVLASLLLPGVSKFSKSGERTKCASNLRQIAAAFQAYSGEHNGMLPPAEVYPAASRTCWDMALYSGGYVNDTRLFACPGDRLKRTDPQPEGINSFSVNSHVFISQNPEHYAANEVECRPSNVTRHLSKVVLVFERPVANKSFNTRGSNLCSHPNVRARGEATDPNLNHGTGANYLFADGHVEFLDYSKGGGSLSQMNTRFENEYFVAK